MSLCSGVGSVRIDMLRSVSKEFISGPAESCKIRLTKSLQIKYSPKEKEFQASMATGNGVAAWPKIKIFRLPNYLFLRSR